MKILVVDDDLGIRTALSTLISRCQHQVVTAVDGYDALQTIGEAKTPFDLIITDHNMPGISGSEFVRQLREISPHAKVIVFAANVSPDDERRYQELNVRRMFSKPHGFKELIEILDGLAKLSTKAQLFWLDSGTAE